MRELKIVITNEENLRGLDASDLNKITEIVTALVQSGGMTGVKGGRTILHFDSAGLFMGVELDYWPWKRRSAKI